MKNSNSHENSANDNTTNSSNNSKQSSTQRLQDISGKIEEAKQTDTHTPNPKKAPLNYIDNMWEWEEAQKKYVEDVANKQQELASILCSYEDKTQETDRFRAAKSELEIKLEKLMWVIIDKLKEDEYSLVQIFLTIGKSNLNDDRFSNEENIKKEVIASWDKNEKIVEDLNISPEKENQELQEQNDKVWNEDNKTNQTSLDQKTQEILNLLETNWFNVANVKIIPIDKLNQWSSFTESSNDNNTGIGDYTNKDIIQEVWYWDSLDEAPELIGAFLRLMDPDYWSGFKKLLNKSQIAYVEKLRKQLRKPCKTYSQLWRQIRIINDKILQLELEEVSMYSKYYKWKKDTKKLSEDFEDTNERYFLNSYLSTKKTSLDSFVSNPLVEKQISNIIELNKQWKPIPKTILLYWNPSSWKSYAANVLASELWRKMYHIRSYDIFTWWFSDPNAMLDAIFTSAIKKKEPCIIFLDEIESYTHWYDWTPYHNLLENTIRHHVSKIKESSLDIIVIWAISNKNKVNYDLFKQDVFSTQIFFTQLSKEKYEELFHKMIAQKNISIDKDVHSIIFDKIMESNINPEYLKKLINVAIDFHLLNNNSDSENITLNIQDINDALNHMSQYNQKFPQTTWFSN